MPGWVLIDGVHNVGGGEKAKACTDVTGGRIAPEFSYSTLFIIPNYDHEPSCSEEDRLEG